MDDFTPRPPARLLPQRRTGQRWRWLDGPRERRRRCTDRTLLPDRRIGKVRHGSGLTLRWSQLAYEVLMGLPLTERVGVKAGWSCGPIVVGCGVVGLATIGWQESIWSLCSGRNCEP